MREQYGSAPVAEVTESVIDENEKKVNEIFDAAVAHSVQSAEAAKVAENDDW